MPAIVTFTCIEGPLKGKIYSFQTRTTFLVGRSHECLITIPKSEESMEISRHHCMIEICPPLARIRDFGSLNGTYLNGKRIGSRGPSQAAGDPKAVSPQCDLANGDTIRMANIQFSVAIDAPEVCRRCGKEIPEKERSQCCTADNPYVCGACRVKEIAERNRRLAAEKQKKERAEAAKRKPAYPKKGGAAAPKPATVKAAGPIPGRAGAPDIMALVAQILEKARLGAPDVQNIKGYKILKTLGRGGMGAVYLAQQEATGKQVALKVMLPQMAANKDAVARFCREMDNAKALRHPHIVQSFESGFADNVFYLTMEVCNAGSLQDLLQKKGGRLALDEGVDLMLQALEGLKYLHTAPIPNVKLADGRYGRGTGLVHRDLKPANLFLHTVNGKPTVKIADLGLAKAFDQAGLSGLTMTGQIAGSPPFMPRQQVIDYLNTRPEVDVWAIAATFYNVLTGAFPRNFPPGKDIWLAILQSDPVPIRQRNPAIPPKLAAVIDRALVDKPTIGFSCIADFQREVQGAL
ncbi:Serine/threonine protein kinase-like protein [Desulfosarcina cetonica]|nr:Serine/threonine protein kinase-like protein [Desulfosarcina cetonica]